MAATLMKTLCEFPSSHLRQKSRLFVNGIIRPAIRLLRTSPAARGLEEFFPPGCVEKGELAPETVKTGRRWKASELRIKSNEDLQKLWYVLLKERNMLNTVAHEARRLGIAMPSPERYHKVKKSMAMIKLVLGERERALKNLENQKWPFETKQEHVELLRSQRQSIVEWYREQQRKQLHERREQNQREKVSSSEEKLEPAVT